MSASAQTRPRRRLRTFLLVLLSLVAITAVGLWVLYLVGASAVAAQERAIRAAGEPLTFDELYVRRPKLPDDQNGALVIDAATDDIKAVSELDETFSARLPLVGQATWPPIGEPVPRDKIDALAEFATQQQHLLDALRVMRDRPHGYFPYEGSESPWETLLPRFTVIRSAVKVCMAAGLNAAVQGDTAEASGRVRDALGVSNVLEHEAGLLPVLVYTACDSLIVEYYERMLALGDCSAADLKAVSAAFREHEDSDALVWAYWGERVYQQEKWPTGATPNAGWRVLMSPVGAGFRKLNEAKQLALMSRLIAIAQSPDNTGKAVAGVTQEVKQLSVIYTIAKLSTVSTTRTISLWNRRTAMLRCARAGIAAELYRQDTGHWPATLDAVVPKFLDAVPTDPFDGQPLRYKRGDGGITIYSVHENEKDDGGVFVDTIQHTHPDVGFRLLDPDRRGVKMRK